MRRPVILIGGGGHGKVLADLLLDIKEEILGYTDIKDGGSLIGVPYIGSDKKITDFKPNEVYLVNGLGSIKNSGTRAAMFSKFKLMSYQFLSVVHPAAVIGRETTLGEGVQIMAGAVIQAGARIGDNVIINTRAAVDHDSVVSSHSHIAPGAVVSGGVNVGENVHVGAGAVIIQGISIGGNTIIGAGAAVIRNVARGKIVAGVPAKEV